MVLRRLPREEGPDTSNFPSAVPERLIGFKPLSKLTKKIIIIRLDLREMCLKNKKNKHGLSHLMSRFENILIPL